MAEFGNFTVGDVVSSISDLLAGRLIDPAKGAEDCRKAVLELSNDYGFQGLQNTGPNIQFTPNVYKYPTDFFKTTGDAGLGTRKVLSFFMYYTTPFIPATTVGGSNPGINLKWVDIRTIENYLNIITLPSSFNMFGGQVYVGPCPDKNYTAYMRYQNAHPFPNGKTPQAANDVILLDDDWQDIVEFATAMRYAHHTRLLDYATDFRNLLYGDPEFQRSGGNVGQPGLIFRRVSQQERMGSNDTRRIQVLRSK